MQKCIDFLKSRKETSFFLLRNLSDYSFKLNENINFVNYYLLKRNNKVVGVFSLAGTGYLLIQTDNKDNYSCEIYEAISKKKIKLKSIFGEWKDCFSFKAYYETITENWTADFISKEYLYSLSLDNIENMNIILKSGVSVKLLTNKDFKQWDILYFKFLKETHLPIEESSKKRKQLFESGVKNKYCWGVFLDKKLVSIANYESKYKDVGQINGVFTFPEERGKGYSKLCMKRLFIDSKIIHQVNNLILLTSENNTIAQNLYKSLNFKQTGSFGLIFNWS